MKMYHAEGFSLLEVLIAIIIVSTGVLGIAGLQVMSLQNKTSALFRTQANQLAYDILDRARANPTADYSIDMTTNAWFTPDNKHLKVSAGTRPLTIPTAIDTFGRIDTIP